MTARSTRLPFGDRTRPPLFLAPMEGVTHPVFRALMHDRGGLDVLCTEFVRVSRAPLSARALRREVAKVPGVPLSVQVMGNDAARMAEAASVLCEAGADVVDVNLGCPMPRVVRKGVGAAMLKDLDLLARVLGAMRAAVPGMLSAKIRAGFDDAAHVLRIADTVQAAGVDFLVVHPRRRADFYEGVADWRIVRVLRETLRIPVVGNGDVWSAADAVRMVAETGCDGVMMGRPAMRNPWIFRQAAALFAGRAPELPDGDALRAHLADVRARYEETFAGGKKQGGLGRMKELLRWVARALPEREAFQREVLRLQDLDAIDRALDRWLVGRPAHRLDLDAHGSLGLERSGSALGAGAFGPAAPGARATPRPAPPRAEVGAGPQAPAPPSP